MSALTMAFVPGVKYKFCPKLRSSVFFGRKIEHPSEYSNHAARTLTFLRDECGDRRSTGQRVIHHIFQLRGGALESFTDWQIKDYIVSKK